MVIDCIIIQEVFNYIYFVLLSRRKIHNISLRFIIKFLHGYRLQYHTVR